jgi:hypothetical protein
VKVKPSEAGRRAKVRRLIPSLRATSLMCPLPCGKSTAIVFSTLIPNGLLFVVQCASNAVQARVDWQIRGRRIASPLPYAPGLTVCLVRGLRSTAFQTIQPGCRAPKTSGAQHKTKEKRPHFVNEASLVNSGCTSIFCRRSSFVLLLHLWSCKPCCRQ